MVKTSPRALARAVLLGAVALCALPALTGCGFVPLYAQQGLSTSLSQVSIETPQTRTGYFLEQDLKKSLGNDPAASKLYVLKVKMTEDHYNIGYRVDDTSTRSEITSAINYTLTDAKSGVVLYTDGFVSTVTYASSTSPFTGIVSQQNGQVRLASAVSDHIQLALATYFHGAH